VERGRVVWAACTKIDPNSFADVRIQSMNF
jgi:hypothetical protein